MSRGEWIFRSIDTSLGGAKAWADSEFQTAYIYALISFFMVAFFVAVAAGMPLIRDDEQKVGDLLHSTPLRPSEYVWGKFLAALLASLAAVLVLPVSTGLLQPPAAGPRHPRDLRPLPPDAPTCGRSSSSCCRPSSSRRGLPSPWGASPAGRSWSSCFPVILFLFCNNFLWGTVSARHRPTGSRTSCAISTLRASAGSRRAGCSSTAASPSTTPGRSPSTRRSCSAGPASSSPACCWSTSRAATSRGGCAGRPASGGLRRRPRPAAVAARRPLPSSA